MRLLVHAAYEYDASGQLTVEQVEDDSSTTVTTYVYDPVGNRLTLEVDGAVTTSTYNVANQLLTAEDAAGVTTYTYDANGNQTTIEVPSGDVTTQTWTCENQLAGVERPDGSEVVYAYAPVTQRADELRVSKEVDGSQFDLARCVTAVSATLARWWHAAGAGVLCEIGITEGTASGRDAGVVIDGDLMARNSGTRRCTLRDPERRTVCAMAGWCWSVSFSWL